MGVIGNITTAIDYFYQNDLDEFSGMPMNAVTFIDRVGSKNSIDLINFLELIKLSPKDKREVSLIEVFFLANVYFKGTTPNKYKKIKNNLFKELFFHKTTKANILNTLESVWKKETARRKDKSLELSICSEIITKSLRPLSVDKIISILEADGDLLLFENKLKICIPNEYIFADVEVLS